MGYLIARKCHSFFTQIIVDVMAVSKNWQVSAKEYDLIVDITKLVNNF